MTINRPDGGPAFLTAQIRNANGDICGGGDPGMSLRDWFAGMAMQGIASAVYGQELPPLGTMVRESYKMADAMLVDLDKPATGDPHEAPTG